MGNGEKASAEGVGNGTHQKLSEEADGGGATNRSKTPCASVNAEPEEDSATDVLAEVLTATEEGTEMPIAEGKGQGAQAEASGACTAGDGGDDGAGSRGKVVFASNATTAMPPDASSPGTQAQAHTQARAQAHTQARTQAQAQAQAQAPPSASSGKDLDCRAADRAAGAGERLDCDGRSCGGDVPAHIEAKVQEEPAAGVSSIEQQQQQQQPGLRDSVDVKNDPVDDARTLTLSSSGCSSGCTTGETRGSTDPPEDPESAFGSECSEGNGNEEKLEDGAIPTAAACEGVDEPGVGTSIEKGPGGDSPAFGSPSRCRGEGERAIDGEAVGAGEGQGTPAPSDDDDGGVVATGESDGGLPSIGSGASDPRADEGPVEPPPAEVKEEEEGESTSAPLAAASKHPLNRLQEPPPRLKPKPDTRHDPDEIDLYSCLDHFMAEEKLVAEDGNGYDCESCSARPAPRQDGSGEDGKDGGGAGSAKAQGEQVTRRRQQNANKRLLMLGQPPGVLVCHLKRLQPKRKIIRSVEFPIELDMAPYFWVDPDVRLLMGRAGFT